MATGRLALFARGRAGVTAYAAAVLIASASIAVDVAAAVPVEESTGTTVRGAPRTNTPSSSTSSSVRTYGAASAPTSASGGSGNAELFYQIQLLQDEVSQLRGLVEEQAHQISRLEESQKEQYLDIDRRLAALASVRGTGSAAPPTMSESSSGPITGGPSAAPPASGDEQTDYAAAYKLVSDGKFDAGIDAFNRFLQNYPDSKYAGNAYYWLGEAYLALPDADLERARHAFSQVQQRFPTHPKVPDAIFKLGVVYHMLGDTPKAIEFLDKVQKDYPGSPAARLAQSYAAELR
jgi:tol-pal system protein YbgF